MKILIGFAIVCLSLLGLALWEFGINSDESAFGTLKTGQVALLSTPAGKADKPRSEAATSAAIPKKSLAKTEALVPGEASALGNTTQGLSATQKSQRLVEPESTINWPAPDGQQQMKQQFRELREILVSEPHNQTLMTAALDLAYRLEWPNEACDLLSRLLRENPEDPALRFDLATQQMRLERWLEAIANLKHVLEQQSENERTLYNLAIAHQSLGHLREARLTWDRVIELIPENPDAYAHRGEVYLDLHDWEKAAEDFKQALKLEPGALDTSMNLALALVKLGQVDQAHAALLPMVRDHPQNVPLLNRLAEITWKLYQADPVMQRALAAQTQKYCIRSLALVNDQLEIRELAEQAGKVAR